MIPARPLWDHWLTGASFLLTTLSLGVVAGAAYLERTVAPKPASPAAAVQTWPILLATGVAASLAQVGVTLTHPLTVEVIGSGGWISLAGLRLFLLLGAAGLLLVALARSWTSGAPASRQEKSRPWAAGALVLLGVSEVVGRLLFYAVGSTNPF